MRNKFSNSKWKRDYQLNHMTKKNYTFEKAPELKCQNEIRQNSFACHRTETKTKSNEIIYQTHNE